MNRLFKLRHHFFLMTAIFWFGVAYYAAVQPPPRPGTTVASGAATAPRVARKAGLPTLSAAELARHAKADDCWIAIEGTVYELTGYVDLHPSKHDEMTQYCGRDGTRPWHVKDAGKDKGKPHTRRSADFLEEYPQVGVLQE